MLHVAREVLLLPARPPRAPAAKRVELRVRLVAVPQQNPSLSRTTLSYVTLALSQQPLTELSQRLGVSLAASAKAFAC